MRRLLLGVALLGACAWSNSLYEARRLSGDATTAERERRPSEAQQLWGQVIVKAESAYAREPGGRRGAEALWLGGHAAARSNDCGRAIPRLQGAMSADLHASWRQQLLLELAQCEEPEGGPSAISLYSTIIATSRDPVVVRHARLRQGHALILREDWNGALAVLAGDDTLPARRDRATADAALGRGAAALAELSGALARGDTTVRWDGYLHLLAPVDGVAADSLLAATRRIRGISEARQSQWLLDAARDAIESDPDAADRRLRLLATYRSTPVVLEGRYLQQQLRLHRATSVADLRHAVDSIGSTPLSDDAAGSGAVARLQRIAGKIMARNDSTGAGTAGGDLAMFGLAETARDSLRAPALAAWFFSRLEREWPRSPYVGKALMARMPLQPDSSATLLQRLNSLTQNPYVAAANGDVAGAIRVTRLEDSLARFVDRMWSRRPPR